MAGRADRGNPIRADGGAPSPERTVLIAEDDGELRETYAIWLPDENWEVREASNGVQALKKLDEAVDVLVLDRHMPRLSGPEVEERLDETDFDGAVLVVTAYQEDEHLDESDVTYYITKPIDRESFLSAVRTAVE